MRLSFVEKRVEKNLHFFFSHIQGKGNSMHVRDPQEISRSFFLMLEENRKKEQTKRTYHSANKLS
jgi:hypothetical protein